MSHASPIGAEYEIPGETIFTFTASRRSGSQPSNFLTNSDTDITTLNKTEPANSCPRESQEGKSEGVVEDVYMSSTHAAEAKLHLYQVLADARLRNIKDVDVSSPAAYFIKAFTVSIR